MKIKIKANCTLYKTWLCFTWKTGTVILEIDRDIVQQISTDLWTLANSIIGKFYAELIEDKQIPKNSELNNIGYYLNTTGDI